MIRLDALGALPTQLAGWALVTAIRHHNKASEAYVDVVLTLEDGSTWTGSVPVTYPKTGLDAQTAADCLEMLSKVRESWRPAAVSAFRAAADEFWEGSSAVESRPFFDALVDDLGDWVCRVHRFPANPNWARRYQYLKEVGFTIATDPSRWCETCGRKTLQGMLLPVERGGGFKYEQMTRAFVKRAIKVLASFDAYEGKVVPGAHLIPDHKFSEVRWDADTPLDNLTALTDSEIRAKFQLLTNQRNQQKREVCRKCFQTGERGVAFGIPHFWTGGPEWPADVPKKGKAAEAGCLGCAWYDLDTWRKKLVESLSLKPE